MSHLLSFFCVICIAVNLWRIYLVFSQMGKEKYRKSVAKLKPQIFLGPSSCPDPSTFLAKYKKYRITFKIVMVQKCKKPVVIHFSLEAEIQFASLLQRKYPCKILLTDRMVPVVCIIYMIWKYFHQKMV